MNGNDIVFDDNYCMYDVGINGQQEHVTLEISDSLEAADQKLSATYKERVADFINSSSKWLPIAKEKIKNDVGHDDGLKLMTIYILYEQDARDSLYGLLFNLNTDREHGRGMMLDGENFEVLKYGDGSVAFEG